jgi:hypothetical protein
MAKRTPKNPYGLDLGFFAVAKQLEAYQAIADSVAGQMSLLGSHVQLVNSLASAPVYNAMETWYRDVGRTIATVSGAASVAEAQRAIVSSIVPPSVLAGLGQSLEQLGAPYRNLAADIAGQLASLNLQIDRPQLQALLVGAIPAFLDELDAAPADTEATAPVDQTADEHADALRKSVASHAPLVFWLALLLLVTSMASYLVTGDLSQGHSEDAMRDSASFLILVMVLADKVQTKFPPG